MSQWQEKKQGGKNFLMILAFNTLSVSSHAVFLTTAFFFSCADNSVLKATFRSGSALQVFVLCFSFQILILLSLQSISYYECTTRFKLITTIFLCQNLKKRKWHNKLKLYWKFSMTYKYGYQSDITSNETIFEIIIRQKSKTWMTKLTQYRIICHWCTDGRRRIY